MAGEPPFLWANGKSNVSHSHFNVYKGIFCFCLNLTRVNILVLGSWVSLSRRRDPSISAHLLTLTSASEFRGWSLVMRTRVSTKCSHISVHSLPASGDCCPLVLSKVAWPSPHAHQPPLRTALVTALLDSGAKTIILGSETDWRQGQGFTAYQNGITGVLWKVGFIFVNSEKEYRQSSERPKITNNFNLTAWWHTSCFAKSWIEYC